MTDESSTDHEPTDLHQQTDPQPAITTMSTDTSRNHDDNDTDRLSDDTFTADSSSGEQAYERKVNAAAAFIADVHGDDGRDPVFIDPKGTRGGEKNGE
jgi:hypothetical protein